MSNRKVWFNGELIPEDDFGISPYDSAVMRGDSVFEMMRSYNKQMFAMNEHLNRLIIGCRATQMPMEYSKSQLLAAHKELIFANQTCFDPDDEYRSLIQVSRGLLPIYESAGKLGPSVLMMVFPLRWVLRGKSWVYSKGIDAYIPSQRTIPAQFLDPKVKNRSRLHYQMADLEIQSRDPKGWALLLDHNGRIAEGTGANFAIVYDNTLYTPETEQCLDGISIRYVLSCATKADIRTSYGIISPFHAYAADEAFFTCTPFGMVPCVSLNGRKIGEGKVGPMTTRLMEEWEKAVGCTWRLQAEAWDA